MEKDEIISDINFLPQEGQHEHSHEHEACETIKVLADSEGTSGRKLFIESYGCQMNFADSEIVASIMAKEGFGTTSVAEEADLIFLNTCSIRDKAEQTVRKRLKLLQSFKKQKPHLLIGILGCMAERLKHNLLVEEKIVDLVAGPDAYRDLPVLVGAVDEGQKAVNVLLSREETYADIAPVRLNSNGLSAFVTITRGCDNVCTFCVVPFTRGRERSRDAYSILDEVKNLFAEGYREITLLGQNVDSYRWTNLPRRAKKGEFEGEVIEVNFAKLLEMVAQVHPDLRVRFSTSHPKDMGDDVLHIMAKYENICKYIHLPFQSGNNRILQLMNRTYTREWYINRIDAIRNIVGTECGISADIIAGFCSETEAEHQETLSLMDYVQFDYGYMFFYSERPGTLAAKKYEDDISDEVKKRRLQEIIDKQRHHSLLQNQIEIGKTRKILIEGISKRSNEHLQGRTSANKMVIFPKENYGKGQYVNVLIESCNSATLFGKIVE